MSAAAAAGAGGPTRRRPGRPPTAPRGRGGPTPQRSPAVTAIAGGALPARRGRLDRPGRRPAVVPLDRLQGGRHFRWRRRTREQLRQPGDAALAGRHRREDGPRHPGSHRRRRTNPDGVPPCDHLGAGQVVPLVPQEGGHDVTLRSRGLFLVSAGAALLTAASALAEPPADIKELKLRDWEPRSMMVT